MIKNRKKRGFISALLIMSLVMSDVGILNASEVQAESDVIMYQEAVSDNLIISEGDFTEDDINVNPSEQESQLPGGEDVSGDVSGNMSDGLDGDVSAGVSGGEIVEGDNYLSATEIKTVSASDLEETVSDSDEEEIEGITRCYDESQYEVGDVVYDDGIAGTSVFYKIIYGGKRGDTLVFWGEGRMYDYVEMYGSHDLYGFRKYKGSITEIVIEEGITNIPALAFIEFPVLTYEIHFPSTLRVIGKAAFERCYKLRGGLVFPDTVEEIGNDAFLHCKSLDGQLKLPYGLKKINDLVFDGCTNLRGPIDIPDTVEYIGECAFYNCEKLEGNLVIPDGITEIGKYTFGGCCSLDSVYIPSSVKKIGEYAFSFLNNVEEIYIPEGVTEIGEATLAVVTEEAKKERRIVLPGSVTELGRMACFYCNTMYSTKEVFDYIKENNSALRIVVNEYNKVELGNGIYQIQYVLGRGKNNINNPQLTDPNEDQVLYEPTRSNHKFEGWYLESDFKTKVTSIPKDVDGTVYLYAKWKKTGYTITYDYNDEGDLDNHNIIEVINVRNYTSSTKTFKLKKPSRKGFIFKGWYYKTASGKEKKLTQVKKGSKKDYELYAKWEPIKSKITYKLDGGKNNPDNPKTFTYITEKFPLLEPTKKGYTFKGWYSDKEFTKEIKEIWKWTYRDITVYAKWEKNIYNINYELEDDEISPAVNDKNPLTYTVTTKTFSLKSPKRTGYSFKGWYVNKNIETGAYSTKKTGIKKGSINDITLYAKWQLNTYKITYNLNKGKLPEGLTNPKTYTYLSEDITFAEPVRAGYEFVGWFTDKKCTKQITGIPTHSTGSMTLYAKWKKITK